MKFAIDSPNLNEDLILKAGRLHWRHIYAYLGAASVCLALGIAVLAYPSLGQFLGDSRLSVGVTVAFLSIPVAFGASAHAVNAEACAPLSEHLCMAALNLAEKYPELETYRKTVVSARQFMLGDYAAMVDFSNQKPSRDACKALHQVG